LAKGDTVQICGCKNGGVYFSRFFSAYQDWLLLSNCNVGYQK